MKKSILISITQLNRAIYDAQNNLCRAGLWYEFLDDIRTPKDCMEHIGDPRYINLKWVIVRSAEFLVQLCSEKNVQMPECIIHTMNPAGKVRIKSTINKEK